MSDDRMTLTPVPRDEYDAIQAERYSHLKYALKSPLHYQLAIRNGIVRTPAMALGDATHVATFEPERFASAYQVYNGKARRGADFELWKRMNSGATALLATERELATAMALAVRNCPEARPYMGEGYSEVVLRWTDTRTGRQCKARVDRLTTVGRRSCIVELKSAKDPGCFDWIPLDQDISDDIAQPRGFATQAAELCYHMQWAMYRRGFLACTGEDPGLVVVAVEKTPPHDVVVYKVPDDVIAAGDELVDRALDIVMQCSATNSWPGKGRGTVQNFRLPGWALSLGSAMADVDFSLLESAHGFEHETGNR
jgi:hypothetical protein